MKGDIEPITKTLTVKQVSFFKEKRCQYCQNYSALETCILGTENISDTINQCIHDELFHVKINIVRAE